MMNPLLLKRYSEGLAAALPEEGEFRAVSGELEDFLALLTGNARLRAILLRPFVSSTKKAAIIEEILSRENYRDKTRRFLQILVQNKRLDLLADVVVDLPARWKALHGIRTFEVGSVIPLSPAQKTRLEEELIRLEKSRVSCSYTLDPSLVGGLFIRKGNRVYDASVKGELQRIKDIIGEKVLHGD